MESVEFWNSRYKNGGNSGSGSYGEMVSRKVNWLKGLPIKTIFEIGCGDFNFGWRLTLWYPDISYTGVDLSEFIIEKNKRIAPQHTFKVGNEIESADLILCVDVLFHILDDQEYEEFLNNLEKVWAKGESKYLAITAYEREEKLDTHVRIRNFPYKRFGVPIIREISEEDGSLYFYLFQHHD